MAKSPRVYTRLTRPSAALGSYKSLWVARDHLLIVNSTGYTEEYARILFRDIKGFFVLDGDRRFWWTFAFGSIALVSAVPMVLVLFSRTAPVVSPFFLALGLVGLIWNHFLGPGCRVFIVTGVQTAPLPSIVRWKRARKVLGKLEPMIRTAQAGLEPAPLRVEAPAVVMPPSLPPPVS